jgi:tetratricopeptide (TPR) repeat protein
LNDNFNTSADYSAYYTYLAQKQFLELYIPLLRSRDAGKADQLLDEIRQAVPANTPEKENEKKSWDLDQTLQNIAPYYRGYPRICYKDAPALKVLGTCSRILAEYESQIKEDSLKKQHFYDSLDLTERDEIALCQRELLRGPLNILYVVAQLLADKQVAPQIIPELEKMFPGDILVLRSGFTDIYWKTGFGPTGTYYLTKLNDRYLDNLDVQTFVQTNYLQAQKHPHNTTAARYFTYIASDPGNASVLSRAYNHLFRLKEMDLAGRVLNIHSRLFPQNDWPKKEALRIKRSDENRFNTREEIREVFPENIEGFYDIWNAASLYRSNGYFDEALKLFIRANEMAPGNSRLAQQLAWSWRLAGQPEKAFQIIENCAIKNGQSLTACYLFCSIAEDYFFTGDTEKARYYYIKANNIDPYFGMSNIGRGYLWYADGDQEKAKEQFKMYHERYQGPDGPVLMCRMLLKQDRVEEALECINQYMQDQDFRNNYLPHWIEAECVYRLGRTDEALKIIRGCADVMAGNMGARCDLAEMYLRIGKPEKAIEYLESEIKSRELGHDVLNPLYCTLISAYLEKNSPFDAIPYLHKCKFFMLDNAVSLSAIGLYEFETGKIDEARKYLESAIRVSPAFTFPRATMVFLETREGRIDQAIQVGEQGLKSCIFYDDTRLYYALSEAYLKKGESQKAAPLLERIVKVDGRMSRWGTRATNLLEKIPR